MQRPDMTIKTLLGIIALLLAVLALRPIWEGSARNAQGQIGSTPRTTTVPTSFQVRLVNRIVFQDQITGVQVINNNNVFIVYTANRVEVYRVDDLPIN